MLPCGAESLKSSSRAETVSDALGAGIEDGNAPPPSLGGEREGGADEPRRTRRRNVNKASADEVFRIDRGCFSIVKEGTP